MLCTFCVACWRSPHLFLVFVASLWSPVFWCFIRAQSRKPFVPTANAFGVPPVLFERDPMFASRHGWQKMTSLSVSYRSQSNSCSHLSWKTRLLFFSGVVLQSSSESLSSSCFRFELPINHAFSDMLIDWQTWLIRRDLIGSRNHSPPMETPVRLLSEISKTRHRSE